jgi:hypothetical protein
VTPITEKKYLWTICRFYYTSCNICHGVENTAQPARALGVDYVIKYGLSRIKREIRLTEAGMQDKPMGPVWAQDRFCGVRILGPTET